MVTGPYQLCGMEKNIYIMEVNGDQKLNTTCNTVTVFCFCNIKFLYFIILLMDLEKYL